MPVLLEVLDEILELFIDLEASDEQLDFPVVYTDAKTGVASLDPDKRGTDLRPLFDLIISRIPPLKVIRKNPYSWVLP